MVARLDGGRLTEAIVLCREQRARAWYEVLGLVRSCAAAADNVDALMARHHPHARYTDHRPLRHHQPPDAAAVRELYVKTGVRSWQELRDAELIDAYPGAIAIRGTRAGRERRMGAALEGRTYFAIGLREGLIAELHRCEELEPTLARLGALSPCARHGALVRRYIEAGNANEWSELARLYAEDYVVVDHRTVGWESRGGAGAVVEVFRQFRELAPDFRGRVEIIDEDGSGVSHSRQIFAGSWQGAPYELAFEAINVRSGDLTLRTELFGTDQQEHLRRRLAELRAEVAPTRSQPATAQDARL